jgi:DNA-binding NtrC family response regulator
MHTAPRAAENPSAHSENSSIRSVLIVDDEPLIRWSIAETLAVAGYRIVQAGTAGEALSHFQQPGHPIAVAVLDLKLPDSTDLGLLRRIRQLAPDCAIILMTAHGTSEILEEAIHEGVSHVVGKPFDLSRMITVITDAISR